MAVVRLGNDWDGVIGDQFRQDYYLKLRQFLLEEYRTRIIYPDKWDIFTALRTTPYANVRVVILGQDPYHGPNQAHGLAFSVKPGVPSPPSLLNIFKELNRDLGSPAQQWVFDTLGEAGRFTAQHSAHRQGRSSRFPPGKGLGGFYHCSD